MTQENGHRPYNVAELAPEAMVSLPTEATVVEPQKLLTVEYEKLMNDGIASWSQIRRENPMLADITIGQMISLGTVLPMPEWDNEGNIQDVRLVKMEQEQQNNLGRRR